MGLHLQDDDDEEEGGEEEAEEGGAAGVRTGGMDVDAGEEARDDGIPVQEIDAYWLQRRIAKTFGDGLDPTAAQRLAEETLGALALADAREVENRLVALLDFERFELIKELLKNRLRVVWCIRLARTEVSRRAGGWTCGCAHLWAPRCAVWQVLVQHRLRCAALTGRAALQTEEERTRVENEMEAGPETRAILDALHATRASGALGRLSALGVVSGTRAFVSVHPHFLRLLVCVLSSDAPRISPPAVSDAARERQSAVERSIREEARRLRQGQGGGEGGGGGAAAAGRKAVDLENLSFAQGAHFNSSKQCTLPQVCRSFGAVEWLRGDVDVVEGFSVVAALTCFLLCCAALPCPAPRPPLLLQGSYRTVHKGFEEVHVPALKPKPFADGAPRPPACRLLPFKRPRLPFCHC